MKFSAPGRLSLSRLPPLPWRERGRWRDEQERRASDGRLVGRISPTEPRRGRVTVWSVSVSAQERAQRSEHSQAPERSEGGVRGVILTLVVSLFTTPVGWALTTGQNADRVVGAPDFTTPAITAAGLAATSNGIFVDSNGKVFVADAGNHRVLIWNNIPTSHGVAADVVVGQANMNANLANRGGSASASTLNAPAAVYSDGTKLYVADTTNNRVLIWNTIPTTNGVAANVVVGQPDTVTTTAGTTQAVLSAPSGVWVTGGKLFVADKSNHRVLIWNSVPTADGTNADLVLGQADFTSGTANRGGATAANALNQPVTVTTDGTKLFVADQLNNRVLIWNTIPTASDTSADVAVGQAGLTSGSANQGGAVAANTVNNPGFAFSDGTKLYVVDNLNNRVLIYNAIPSAHNASADVAVGQTSLTSSGSGTSATTLNAPGSTLTASSKLFVSDVSNSRVLIWSSVPTAHGAAASVVVGQTALTNGCDNQRCPPAANRFSPSPGVFSTGSSLFVGDYNNARVLRFNAIPSANGVNADVGIGVSNLTSVGGGPAQNIIGAPEGLWVTGSRLIVSDVDSHRVLIWDPLPTTHGANASLVLGQANFTSGSANRGGAAAANTFNLPQGVSSDGTKLVVADYSNNRVLIWNTFPTTNGQAADVVVGQANFTSTAANRGGAVGANTLSGPLGVLLSGGKLIIVDSANQRVLIYTTVPTSHGASANVVIGQVDFTSSAFATAANRLTTPTGVAVDPTGVLYIADYDNHRVLVFNSIPTTNNASADIVLGQADMTSGSPNRTAGGAAPAANTLRNPELLSVDSSYLYVGDGRNNRVLMYAITPAAPASLTVTPASASSVALSWSANGNTSEVTYGVERAAGACSGSPSFTEVTHASSRPTATTYTDTGLSASTSYCYRVRTFASHGGASNYAASVSTTTSATSSTPTNLAVTEVTTTSIALSWTGGSGLTYGVERAASSCSGTFTEITDSSNRSSVASYTSSGLALNTASCFRVRAFNSAGTASAYSATVSKATLAAPPTSLTVASTAKDGTATLSWSANSNPSGTTFVVQRAPALTQTTCGSYTTAQELTGTTYVDSPTSDAYYCYRVSAKNLDGTATAVVDSLYNFVQPSTTAAAPADVQELHVQLVDKNTVKLSWPEYQPLRKDGRSFTLGGFDVCLVTVCGVDFSAFRAADFAKSCESVPPGTTSYTVDLSKTVGSVQCVAVLPKDKIDQRATETVSAVDLANFRAGTISGDLDRAYIADDRATLLHVPGTLMEELRKQIRAATGLEEGKVTLLVKEVPVSETAKKTMNVVKEVKVSVAKATSGTVKEELNVVPQLISPFKVEFQYEAVSSLARPSEAPERRRPALIRELAAKVGETKNLGVFFKAGDAWVPVGGKIDPSNKKVTLETARLGSFQLREVLRGTEFKLTRVFPRVITPNGDGWNDVVVFQMENPAADTVTGEIFDMSGAKVADLVKVSNEENSYQWDGKDSGGRVVPMGVYLYQIKGGSNKFSGTVVVAR